MPLLNSAVSALANLILLVLLPGVFYWLYHKKRHGRSFKEVLQRAGIGTCEKRYLGMAALFTLVNIGAFLLWMPPVEFFTREGSAQQAFAGLGLSAQSIIMALIYGGVKTGFAEEFLFRGMIAGSLGRRLSLFWANFWQAVIFLIPHLVVVFIIPEIKWFLVAIFAGSCVLGWLRIKSGSILGPWLVHAAINITSCLAVAIGTAP